MVSRTRTGRARTRAVGASEHDAVVGGQPPFVVHDVERQPGRLVPVRGPVALPGHAQGPGDGQPDDQGTSGEGRGSRGVGVAREDGCDARERGEQGGQLPGLFEHAGVAQGVVERDRRLVEGDQRRSVLRFWSMREYELWVSFEHGTVLAGT